MSAHLLNMNQLFELLLEIDQDLAAKARTQARCWDCEGTKFHRGDFPRQPRGCPQRFRKAYSRRASLDCANCRARTTPPSVRFLPRRVYLAAVVVLMSLRRATRVEWLAQELQVPRRTV